MASGGVCIPAGAREFVGGGTRYPDGWSWCWACWRQESCSRWACVGSSRRVVAMIEMDDKDIRRAMASLSRAMRSDGVNKQIKRDVSKRLRMIMRPMVEKRKAAVHRLPSKGHEGAGMRDAIARQTRAATRWSGKSGGVSIIQRARGMPRGFNMAGRMFNRAQGWNPSTLGGERVHQQIRPVEWFDSVAQASETKMARQEIVRALEDTAGRLASEIRRI